ncbi:MAG: DUF4392 domain-containing protein [Deltaproteobacteria bacterium]|nr:MAG: DUF4392 domain-containing protein [Deltaproteobacteria bacterium]
MEIQRLADQIDRLITLDLPFRGVIDVLYPSARERAGEPLAMKAAKELHRLLKAKDVVLIATGWPDRPHISPEIAETDGPPGAAALGRALHRGLKVIPFFLIEENLVGPMERVVQSAGFRVLPPKETIAAGDSPSAIHAAAVLGFPSESKRAKKKATLLMNTFKPAAVIAIEKGGMNEKGIVHTSRGHDTTEPMAKIDFLMEEAIHRNVLTLGIGDGGNEIGMGNIREEIKQKLPFGDKCLCPCGSGIAPVTQTDLLVTATVSNWGAYGVSACLAILLKKPDVLHDPETERRILEQAAGAGFIDGISGFVEPGADGLAAEVHCQITSLLNLIVKKGCSS